MRVLRSMLFVPGNNMRMIHKATTLDADAVILDLEDAVPMLDKETARIFIRDSVEMLKSTGLDLFVRVNGLSTGLTVDDLKFVIQRSLDGIMLPKCESEGDVLKLCEMIAELERERRLDKGNIVILPIIETAKGVLNAYEVASASSRVCAISFGAVDFTRELGTTPSKDGTEILYARSYIAISAIAANVQAIDTPWIDIMDMEGLMNDAKLARRLGFRGKLLIHPKQIAPVNGIFTPAEEEIRFAEMVVEEFTKAQAAGQGAISIEGNMIDIASFHQASQLLSLWEAIGKKEAGAELEKNNLK
jgi:citrate lyase subunit beta/citryl-CoA lyase